MSLWNVIFKYVPQEPDPIERFEQCLNILCMYLDPISMHYLLSTNGNSNDVTLPLSLFVTEISNSVDREDREANKACNNAAHEEAGRI